MIFDQATTEECFVGIRQTYDLIVRILDFFCVLIGAPYKDFVLNSDNISIILADNHLLILVFILQVGKVFGQLVREVKVFFIMILKVREILKKFVN